MANARKVVESELKTLHGFGKKDQSFVIQDGQFSIMQINQLFRQYIWEVCSYIDY